MSAVEKISDITAANIAEYLRIAEPTESELEFLQTCKDVAIKYILNYTGILTAAELDAYTDMIIVLYVLCQDMYDTRTNYIDNSNVNVTVETILGMHQRNLL